MPHVVCEYSDPVSERVNMDLLLEGLHQCLIGSGEFEPANIKTRAYACHNWLIGESDDRKDFIHITLSLFEGRSVELKKALSERLLAELQKHAEHVHSLSVNVCDIDTRVYSKSVR